MTYTRRIFSLDPDTDRLVRQDADTEGISDSEAVRRAVHTRAVLLDLIRALPPDETGRFARVAVLPESFQAPPELLVTRLFVSIPALPTTQPEGNPA